MFARYMYKQLHANECNFMTHYTCHAHVETVGCLSWELASVCQLPSFGSAPEEPIFEIKICVGDSNTY